MRESLPELEGEGEGCEKLSKFILGDVDKQRKNVSQEGDIINFVSLKCFWVFQKVSSLEKLKTTVLFLLLK